MTTTILQFALLGVGAGAAYALLAQGLVLIHRGSGVVNFSHAAMALVGAFLYYELHAVRGVPMLAAVSVSVLVTACIGAAVYLIIMRPLLHRSGLSRIIATLGLLIIFQGVCSLIWGDLPKLVSPLFPTELVRFGGIAIGGDRFYLLAVGVVVTIILWLGIRFSRTGMALRANAENPVAAATLGWSSQVMGTLTWSVGAALAALAGILIAPLTGIEAGQMPLLVIPALAAALIGGFKSFPLTLVAALFIGVLQSVTTRFVEIPGIGEALPFLIILITLVIRRQGIKERRQAQEVLPSLGSGRVRPIAVIVTVVVASALVYVLPVELVYSLTATVAVAIVMLSVVVLLGYTGQLSLAQMAIAGMGALIAGRLVSDTGAPFLVALIVGVLCAIPIGVLFALPALRTKGANLAVVTLGLAVTTSAIVFNNSAFTGGAEGTSVGYPTVFGFEIDSSMHPERYAIVVIIFFALCALVVTNIRRGTSGRRLVAVRTNERAASALGVNIFGAKLFAFAFAAAVASLGGILMAFRNPFILYQDFSPLNSILVVAYVVVGGVGYIFGAFNGGTLIGGGIGAWIMHSIAADASPVWLHIIGGLLVTIVVVLVPNGLAVDQVHLALRIRSLFIKSKKAEDKRQETHEDTTASKVTPATLTIDHLTVRFGGVVANNDISLAIHPGEVLGLIGPNGAGKTTLIDAVTGFVTPGEGTVRLNDETITSWRVHRRSRAGISRSFQALELFESSTVRENLRVASDPVGSGAYFRDLVWPRQYALSPTALDAVRLLGLEDELDTIVSDMSYGRRRLVAIARAVASAPSVLLLDEPAAGLSAEETKALGEVVKDLARNWGIAILVVEHDMSFVMNVCDKLTVLDFGRQIGYGTPAEIREDPAVIAAYLGGDASASTGPGVTSHSSTDAEVSALSNGMVER